MFNPNQRIGPLPSLARVIDWPTAEKLTGRNGKQEEFFDV